jgi:arabinosaccharide transport system substrate-binding protein
MSLGFARLTTRRLGRRRAVAVLVGAGALGLLNAACGGAVVPTPTSAPAKPAEKPAAAAQGAPATAPAPPPTKPGEAAKPAEKPTEAAKPAAAAPAPAKGAEKLEFWTFSEQRTEWWQKALKDGEWQKKNPSAAPVDADVRVFPTADMHDKLLASFAAGVGAPDISDVHIEYVGRFWKGDKIGLLPLNDVFKDELGNFAAVSAYNPWSWQNKIYGLGNELNAATGWYRWDVYEQAGIKGPFKTWEDWRKAGREVTAKTKSKVLAVADNFYGHWLMLSTVIGGATGVKGGFVDENGSPIVNNESGVKALEFLADIVNKDQIAMLAPQGPSYWAGVNNNDIVGEIGAPWAQGNLFQNSKEKTAGKWTVQPFYEWENGGPRTSSRGGTGTSIMESSKNRELAGQFLRWMYTTDVIMYDYVLRKIIPTYKPMWNDPRLNQPDAFFNNVVVGKIVQESATRMESFFNSPFLREISDGINRAITPVMQGKKPAKPALDELKADLDKLIAQQRR